MYEEQTQNGILAQPKKAWPLTNAANMLGIAGQLPVQFEQVFADGGKVENADEIMARMAAKYGTTGAAQAASVQPPPQSIQKPSAVQQPQATPATNGILSGAMNALRNRQQQIDKAAGYAGGGKIKGPGTATSDSIPAQVVETGEPIRVANEERIVSAEQDKFLEGVATQAGFKSLDDFLEAGTGKPVGPTIKAGKRAAEDGLSPDLDPFAFRGGKEFGAAGPVNGPSSTALTPAEQGILSGISPATPVASKVISAAIGAVPQGADGVGRPEAKQPIGDHGVSQNNGIAAMPTGRNAQGVITAESAKGILAEPMQRSGGIYGTFDGKGVNDILARENKARGEMIDSMIKANGGNGIGILGEAPTPVGDHRLNNPLLDELRHARIDKMQAGTDQEKRLGGLQQSLIDETDPAKRETIAGQIRAIEGKAPPRPANNRPTLAQARSNAEIDAARERISGTDAAEIKRRTANFTATGRENPDFDPTLAKAVSLANRRKIGDDPHFDERQQAQQPAGTDGDVMTRFRSDRAMQGHKLGNQTDQGIEVFDASGRLVGHYR